MSLRRAATKGVKWTGAAGVVTAALQSLRLVVIARLLSPEDFGLMAMIMVLMGFAGTFADTGFSDALIYRQEATRDQISSLYWTTWVSGLIIFGALIAATPVVAEFYREPRINALLPWAAAYFLIGPAGQQFKSLLQKDLRFAEIATIEIAAAIVATLSTIGLALLGYGIYALIFGQLLGGVVDSILLAFVGWRIWPPHLHYRLKDLRGFASFGAFQIGERWANTLSANVDYLLIGRVLGPLALGPYTVAYQLIVAPVLRINPILIRVAFPIFAKKQNDSSALRIGFIEISRFLSLVTCPLLFGVAAAAPVLIPVFLGSAWGDAVQLAEILAPVGLLKTFSDPGISILLAMGRANLTFWLNFGRAIQYSIVFSLVVGSGTKAIAISYLIVVCVNFVFTQTIINRALLLSWSSYLSAIMKYVASAFAMAVVVRICLYVIVPETGIGLWSAALLILIGAISYGLCIIVSDRAYILEIMKLLKFQREARE